MPGYGDDAELSPYPEDDELAPWAGAVPRSLVAVAGILAVVLVGVLAFVMLRPGSGGTGTPPIITADAGPTKIAPPEPPSAGNGDQQQNKLIYDRVDPSANNSAPADTKLVTPGNQPIAQVPSTDTNNPIARVILPGGPATDAPGAASNGTAGDNGANAATDTADAQSLGPRKVRTVIVRPDGTIVSSDAAPAPGDAPASTDAVPTPPATTATETPAAPTPPPAVPPVATNDDTAAIAGEKSGQELTITTHPDATTTPTETPAAPPATRRKRRRRQIPSRRRPGRPRTAAMAVRSI